MNVRWWFELSVERHQSCMNDLTEFLKLLTYSHSIIFWFRFRRDPRILKMEASCPFVIGCDAAWSRPIAWKAVFFWAFIVWWSWIWRKGSVSSCIVWIALLGNWKSIQYWTMGNLSQKPSTNIFSLLSRLFVVVLQTPAWMAVFFIPLESDLF